MKKLYALSLPLFLTNVLCQASAYEKFAIVAVHVGIPLAFYTGNVLMARLRLNNQKSPIVLSSDIGEFTKQIQERYGPKAFALVQNVMNDVQQIAPSASYEYHNLYSHPAQLIIHHNEAKNYRDIRNKSYTRNNSWRLVPSETLSDQHKTVVQFQPITMEDREREGTGLAFEGAS